MGCDWGLASLRFGEPKHDDNQPIFYTIRQSLNKHHLFYKTYECLQNGYQNWVDEELKFLLPKIKFVTFQTIMFHEPFETTLDKK